MQDYRNLEFWQVAHQLTVRLYQVTRTFPREEVYMLTSQIRRSAASIGYNLAEGCGMGADTSFARFVQIAVGSASELDYQLLLARDLGFISSDAYTPLAETLSSLRRRLTALLNRLRSDEK